ncbi:hypothetical protein G6F57_019084 [Rhizopus arrhizus]|nr:hypothetical protein G6F57_019084 [Rhizopus arrhizus]
MLAGPKVAETMQFGAHGTTFGGNPLAAAVARVALRKLASAEIAANVSRQSKALRDGFARINDEFGVFSEVRGRGLMLGIELARPCGVLALRALEAGLLINVTRDRVIRMLPPLILNQQEADQIVSTLVPLIQQFLAETSHSTSRPGHEPGRVQ